MNFSDISPIFTSIFITSQTQSALSPDLTPLYVAIIAAVGTILSKTPELLNTFFSNRKSEIHKFNIDEISFLKIKQISKRKIDDKSLKSMKYSAYVTLTASIGITTCVVVLLISGAEIFFSPITVNPSLWSILAFKWLNNIFIFIVIVSGTNYLYNAIRYTFLIWPIRKFNNAEEIKPVIFEQASLTFECNLNELMNNVLTIIKYMNIKLVLLETSEQGPKVVKFVTRTKLMSRMYEMILNIREEGTQSILELYFSKSTRAAYVAGSAFINRFINLAILDFQKTKKS